MSFIPFQHRHDTAANWAANNPVLLKGEWGYDETNNQWRFGDGATAWNSLTPLGGSGTVTSVSGAGTVAGLTLTGTVTGAGSITLGGTLSTTAASISDFNSATRAQTEAELIAGTNVTITPAGSGATRTLTIAASGGGVSDGDKGDITVSGSGVTWTIDADTITNAKLANMATATFKGRVTAATGDPEDLTGTQATSLLDTFTSALKGLAPASGGGTANFLRADGTWAAPTAVVSDGDKGDITVSLSGTNWIIDTDAISTTKILNETVTNAKLAKAAAFTFKGNDSVSAASPRDMNTTDARTILNVADGATANSSDATLLNRANHTGTQLAATISDFASTARAETEAELIAGTNVTITPAGSGATRTLTIAATGGGGGLSIGLAQALSTASYSM